MHACREETWDNEHMRKKFRSEKRWNALKKNAFSEKNCVCAEKQGETVKKTCARGWKKAWKSEKRKKRANVQKPSQHVWSLVERIIGFSPGPSPHVPPAIAALAAAASRPDWANLDDVDVPIYQRSLSVNNLSTAPIKSPSSLFNMLGTG